MVWSWPLSVSVQANCSRFQIFIVKSIEHDAKKQQPGGDDSERGLG